MAKIAIVGAGQMASALSFPAFENGHEVRLVGTPIDCAIIDSLTASGYHPTLKRNLHDGISYFPFEALSTALNQVDLVICGVSSFGVEWFANYVLPQIPPLVPILSVTKGMYLNPDNSLVTYPQYWNNMAEKPRSISAIGGACTSYELAQHVHSVVTYCGDNIDTLQYLRKLMETDYYHIQLTTDLFSVEFAVAIKNLYALAVCLAVGMAERRDGDGAHHYNTEAALFSQSVREMHRLVLLFGGSLDSVLCGISDLYGTIYGGRTRKIGILLGKGMGIEQALACMPGETLESIVVTRRMGKAIRAMAEHGDVIAAQFPLLMLVDSIVSGTQQLTEIDWAKLIISEQGS
ncbi:MAG: glycerol-3-phosphate dehydrogenase [Hydrogenoanaerobacterium sp.]